MTFPHLGDTHRFGDLLMKELGIPVVRPRTNCQEGLERGSALSPEDICLPFKLMVDNLLSAWELGADTVIMPATMGPCRLGEYGELLKKVTEREGCAYRFILLDAAEDIGLGGLAARILEVGREGTCSRRKAINALLDTYRLIVEFEKLEAEAHLLSGFERDRGTAKGLLEDGRKDLDRALDLKDAIRAVKARRLLLAKVERDPERRPLRLLLTGEIYSSIEPFANHRIEDLLMTMGVAFERRITLGWWLRNTVREPLEHGLHGGKNPYLPVPIGGYAHETTREALRCKKGGYDGIVQILPAGCMPEIVAKSIFDAISRQGELSILTVIFDEMSGEAGYITRIEAFLDMLERRRDKRLIS